MTARGTARGISWRTARGNACGAPTRRRRPATALAEDDIRAMIERLGDLAGVLKAAEPVKNAALYENLGLPLTYGPGKRRMLVEADLSGVRTVRVGGGI
ncbi:MAG: hypothetical protein WD276_00520 [Actinomycetota bacterium]